MSGAVDSEEGEDDPRERFLAQVANDQRAAVQSTLRAGRTAEHLADVVEQAETFAEGLIALVRAKAPPSERVPACREGCAFCCHVPVAVTAAEAIRIADRLRATLAADGLAEVRRRVAAVA